jgi:hypothetical protein
MYIRIIIILCKLILICFEAKQTNEEGSFQKWAKPSNPRLVYETQPATTEFGASLVKRLFPAAKILVEPCVGHGSMIKPLTDAGYIVIEKDKYTREPAFDVLNDTIGDSFDLVFTNPPFSELAKLFKMLYGYVKKGNLI